MKTYDTAVIFGGTGFIGTHTAIYYLSNHLARKVILVDINPPRIAPYTELLQAALRTGQAEYVAHDVRQPIPPSLLPDHADLIFDFAAVHREPGHEPREYYESNLLGADNVCSWASSVACKSLVFTSSISPYGPTEDRKDELSIPVPETAYGGSKLVAEKIHMGWQMASPERRLLIVRPGVVFGPGEGGNVTRLVRLLVRGFFLYMGNKETRKAGGYVKELCRVFDFGLNWLEDNSAPFQLLNFGVNPTPRLSDFVNAINEAAHIDRSPFNVPRWLLLGLSHVIHFVTSLVGIKQPINPVRVRKLFRSTWIEPQRLSELGYTWRYTLKSAFEDWKRDIPSDFTK